MNVKGKRIAIVGNAPHALRNKEDIDSFDCIIRFNHFQLGAGFEALGSRTDVLALPGHSRYAVNDRIVRFNSETRHVLDLSHQGPENAGADHRRILELLPQAAVINGRDVARKTRRHLAGRALPKAPRCIPTTGLSAIAWAMGGGPSEIYLTGFSFEEITVNHYFGSDSRPCRNHDPIRELKWIADRREHRGLRVDEHIAERIERWCIAYLRLGSAMAAYCELSGILPPELRNDLAAGS